MNYWTKRTQQNEEYAAAIAASYSKRQEKYYKQAYRKIAAELNKFYAAVADGQVSRTQLWNYVRYQNLLDNIANDCQAIGMHQIGIMDIASRKIFKETIGVTLEDFNKGNLFKSLNVDELMRQTVNSKWSGQDFSNRVWRNTNKLSYRLQNDIQSMIAIGKSPTEIKAQIARDFNTSYKNADRLIRTESSYIYNTAAVESYKLAGCEEVQFLAEADACEECASYDGNTYAIGTEPRLPIHPNCRCTYIPVVDFQDRDS